MHIKKTASLIMALFTFAAAHSLVDRIVAQINGKHHPGRAQTVNNELYTTICSQRSVHNDLFTTTMGWYNSGHCTDNKVCRKGALT